LQNKKHRCFTQGRYVRGTTSIATVLVTS